MAAVGEAIERHRLVTLRGPAGVGKTRLALRAAAGLRDTFADGCWLVQLSPLQEPELLARTVSLALGLPDEDSGDAPAVLARNLAERELLLVLDTCEHLTAACAQLAGLLLPAAPGLRILATSRSPLGLAAEHTLAVNPLEVPADDAGAARADAVTLFVDRARAAVPDFALTPGNTAAVAELCRRLDGIPLALELAAVRLRGMPVDELLARLSDRFRVLGTARTATDRHRTLRAAVAWSYELCAPAEQRLWAELSVFPGVFGLAAAEYVGGPGAGEVVRRLADKSVVQLAGVKPGGGEIYHLLDTMREFGAEVLGAAGPAVAAGVRARHRDYYLRLAEQAAAGIMTAGQPAWLNWLSAETANLRVALDFSFGARPASGGPPPDVAPSPAEAPGERSAGLRMTRALLPYWLMTGQFTEGRRWHDLAVAAAGGPEAGGSGSAVSGSAGSDLAGSDLAGTAWAVFGAGVLAVQQGDFAAGGPLLARATELARAVADEDLTAHVTDARGMLAFYSGDLPAARAEFESALAAGERAGFRDPTALVTYSRLASVCLLALELDRAVKLCEECLRRCAEIGEQWARGTALWTRGAARWLSGDNAAAIEDVLACLRIKEQLDDLHTIAMSFDLLSVCLVASGDFERTAVLHGASERLWALLNAPALMGPAYSEIRKSGADTARGALGEERFDALVGHGYALPLAAALAVARGDDAALRLGPADGAEAKPGFEVKPLTRRERQIAGLVADGLGNREIAEQLYLSKRTVDSHLEHIFTKLGFTSRTQLAAWVLERREPG